MALGLWGMGLAAAVAGGPVRLDLSALDPGASDYPVARLGAALCGPGRAADGDVLAVAIVTYGRRPGRSAWGHTSLRFLACEAGLLQDVEYEYYRMDASIERWFRATHPTEAWTIDAPYLHRQHGQLVVVRNERPADGGFYAAELDKNREVIEAWMPWSADVRRTLYQELDHRHHAQLARLRAGADLDGLRYEPMGTNCTLHVRQALAVAEGRPHELAGSVFPMRTLRWLEEQPDVRLVLHPSDHVLRSVLRESGVPREVDRIPHGILRRRLSPARGAVVEDGLPEAVPVVVEWLLGGSAGQDLRAAP